MAPKGHRDESALPASGEAAAAPDPTATADYVAAITTELATLSRRSGLDLLAYFLDIARLEALEHARRRRAVS
jgi:hypothetical protein